ncbi:NAD(P)-binding protein [Panus rudis PR-1116 ss-1]|nr:NAD(P)-binding protein [Panus rudis PR-1116 ss-1]
MSTLTDAAANNSDSPNQLVWFITGTSSGFGRRLVTVALSRGDKVIATARNLEGIEDFPPSPNLRKVQLDVTIGAEKIKEIVDKSVTYFGRIDVLVNNAGIGVTASIEEGGSKEWLDQVQTNVIGLLDVTSAALPHMRSRNSGTVVLLGSRTSWRPELPLSGQYASSKAAVRVIGETLSAEVAPFGIRVLIVEPGAFRTEKIFSRPLSTHNTVPAYDPMRERFRKAVEAIEGKQPGDPMKAMELVADVVRGEGKAKGKEWPLYLPLGKECEQAIRDKCAKMLKVVDEWGEIIRDTVLDDVHKERF